MATPAAFSEDPLVIASRGSRLALTQAEIVSNLLRARHADLKIEVETVRTSGDADARPFAEIGGKGLFTSEVERRVVEGDAHVAVHSAKDLTAELAPGCEIICVPVRAARADVVAGGRGDSGEERLGALEPGATVGTSSMRRRALVVEARPDLHVVEFRGNLDTRLAKVSDGAVEVAILAAAGIERLYRSNDASHPDTAALDPSWWVPAPAQGALAIEARADRLDVAALFEDLSDRGSRAEVACERAFSARLEGGCSVPLGCTAVVSGADLTATGYLATPDAAIALRDRISGPVAEAASLGTELAEALLGAGGDEVLDEIRASELTEPSAP